MRGGIRPGQGRPPGSPNRITREIRELLAPLSEPAITRLGKLLDSSDDALAFKVCELVLSYCHGRPRATLDLGLEPNSQAISPETLEDAGLSDEQLKRLAGLD